MNSNHRPMTVGALRRALEGHSDDMPLCIAAPEEEIVPLEAVVATDVVSACNTISWGEDDLTYDTRPYLLINTRTESVAEHHARTTPATTEEP